MKDLVFLVFTKRGVDRMTHREPTLKQGEFTVKVRLSVPDSVFMAAPVPVAELTLPEGARVTPQVEVSGEVVGPAAGAPVTPGAK